MDKVLTVLVQTSPIPSHPSTALIEALFRSFAKADGLMESRIVVLADGCEEIIDDEDDEQVENIKHGKASPSTAANYRQFLQKLRTLIADQTPPFCPHRNGIIELLELPTRHGSAPAIRAAMETVVSTPLVMICQHDNFFINEAPVRTVATALVETPGLGIGATCIHFLSTATMNYVQKVKRRYGLVLDPVHGVLPCPLVPLVFWYGRTHVSYSSYVREYALNRPLPKGSHLEEVLGEKQLHDILSRGPEAHCEYGTYVLDQGMEALYHLSGRRAVCKEGDDADGEETALTNNLAPQNLSSSQNGVASEQAKVLVPMEGAFTVARTCRAVVPGLVFPPTGAAEKRQQLNNTKKFKGRCFHCNARGHSKMYCPLMKNAGDSDDVNTEIIDLS